MALHVIVAEGYTDCALLEAILEKYMGFQRYTNLNDMPEFFRKLVGQYPGSMGEMERRDMPHFFYKDNNKVTVKVAGGESKLANCIWEVLETWLLCGQENKFAGFLVFTDADKRSKETISLTFKKNYEKFEIEYDPDQEEIFYEGKQYRHSIYVYPQCGYGAVEKILLLIAEYNYPELTKVSLQFRQQLEKEQFSGLRKKNWAKDSEIQEFYADKVQFGAIVAALKPDRPVGFAIKDNLIKKENQSGLMQIEEFQKLYQYLKERIMEK